MRRIKGSEEDQGVRGGSRGQEPFRTPLPLTVRLGGKFEQRLLTTYPMATYLDTLSTPPIKRQVPRKASFVAVPGHRCPGLGKFERLGCVVCEHVAPGKFAVVTIQFAVDE
jgi:hypothetical protein